MKRTIAAALLALIAVASTYAFSFSPITKDLDPSGPGASTNFTAVNDTDETVALRISLWARSQDRSGKDELQAADGDFTVYPSRITLKPGESQRVRVRYQGGPVSGRERAYRIVAEQLPVVFGDTPQAGGLKILFRYVGSVYVHDGPAKSEVRLVSCERETGEEGDVLAISLENRGAGHAILTEPSLTLVADGIEIRLGPDALSGLSGSNVLAGSTLDFRFPWPRGLTGSPEGKLGFVAVR